MEIRYDKSEIAWEQYERYLISLIERIKPRSICEVGGGANPALPVEWVRERGIEYTILDISEDELDKAPAEYTKLVGNISDPSLSAGGQYDFVFSRMLAEHVARAEVFHKNVWRLLKMGGVAFHFFPTMYAFPFLVNKLIPESVGYFVLRVLQGDLRVRTGNRGKFPAFYDWCYGPSERQCNRFERVGYRVEEYVGFFGHEGYYRKFGILRRAHGMLVNMLLKHPIPQLTSYAYVVLRKI